MQNTCIIIPCYNEEKRLEPTRFTDFLLTSKCDLCFVNDGSDDLTLDLLVRIQEAFPEKIKIMDLKQNQGKAEAVRKGILDAVSDPNYDFIGYFDADLATPLEEIEFLLGYFQQGYNTVIGSRVKRLGAKITRSSTRHYLGRVFATVASVHLDIKVYDSQCGAKIFSRDVAKFLFTEPFITKWLFDLEVIHRLKKNDTANFEKNILEVPLRTWREQQHSKMRFKDFLNAPFDLYRIK